VPNPAAKPKDEDRCGLKPEVILGLFVLNWMNYSGDKKNTWNEHRVSI